VAEIRDLIDGFRGDSRGDMRGDTCHDTCHPEIRSISYGGQIQNRQNALCETRGGSDA
jgi:hypothetical protein